MSKKEKFIELVNVLMDNVSVDETEWADALTFFEAFKAIEEKEKPEISEKGAAVLLYLQENIDNYKNAFSAKAVGEGMNIPTRSISPTMRGMVSGGFLEKISDKPAIYSLTEKGKVYKVATE